MKFAGFDREAIQFFHELAIEMTRDWFEANKERHRRLWVEPMTALLSDVRAGLTRTYGTIAIGEPKLFRIHRDVRFAKDKTPYKTHAAGMLSLHAKKKPVEGGCSALYIQIGLEDEYVGGGTYFFDAAQLARWRKLVIAERTGREIAALISKLRTQGYDVGGHDDYKRVPKGLPADHPRADLLRMRGLTAEFPAIPRGLIHRPAFGRWVIDHAKAIAPLVRWLYTNVK